MIIITKYVAKPQFRPALEKALRELIIPMRKTRGCLRYDLHVSLDMKLVFFVDEMWSNDEAWKACQSSPIVQKFDMMIEGIIDEKDVCIAR